MKIFLLRHFESEKNVGDRLSGTDYEKLTPNGRRACEEFSGLFKRACNNCEITISEIDSADSERARETTKIIRGTFDICEINYYMNFRSTKAGMIAGKSFEEIRQQDPFFAKYYELYRKGLLNSYYFDNNWKDETKESKKIFETRVISCFNQIVDRNDEDNAILLVAHRASITAILIHVARKMGLYPECFYGNVESSVGGLSCVSLNKGKWDIDFVNIQKEEIANVLNTICNKS